MTIKSWKQTPHFPKNAPLSTQNNTIRMTDPLSHRNTTCADFKSLLYLLNLNKCYLCWSLQYVSILTPSLQLHSTRLQKHINVTQSFQRCVQSNTDWVVLARANITSLGKKWKNVQTKPAEDDLTLSLPLMSAEFLLDWTKFPFFPRSRRSHAATNLTDTVILLF